MNKPQNQNKYFFSDGKTYYEQICKMLRLMSVFKQAFNQIYDNEDEIHSAWENFVDNLSATAVYGEEVGVNLTWTDTSVNFAFTIPGGEDGVGIQSITFNSDYTMTITLTDGQTYTSGSLRGPQGEQGIQGIQGETGPQGPAGTTPVISATASVGTGTGTPSVSVTKSGTDAAPSFAFAFNNLKGAAGQNGQGVPTGGIAGQVLTKVDGTDYNTQWSTPQSGGGNPIYMADNAATYLSAIYNHRNTDSNYFPICINRITASTVGFGYGNYVRSNTSYDRDGTALEQYFNSVSAITFSVTNIQKPFLNGSRYCSRAIGRMQLTSNNVTYVYVGQFMLFWMSASAIGIVPFGAFWLSNNAMHGECNLYSGIDRFFSIQASNVTAFEAYYTVGERV